MPWEIGSADEIFDSQNRMVTIFGAHAMNTLAYESIAQFCIEQHTRFDSQAWRRRGAADTKLIAVAAKYLSMTSWFGHEEQLEKIAVDIDASVADDQRFHDELGSIGLDLALFSASVRGGIATRKAPMIKPDRPRVLRAA